MRRFTKHVLYDRIHQFGVTVCIAVTVLGHAYLGYRAYQYYTCMYIVILRDLSKLE